MKCPFCSAKTIVYNSRSSHQATQTWRRRRCIHCEKTFTTREKVDFNKYVTVSTHGSTAFYSRERLLLSLARASDKLNLPPEVLTELTDSIELDLKEKGFFTNSPQKAAFITAVASSLLGRYDKNLALQYINQVYRNKPPLELLGDIIAT